MRKVVGSRRLDCTAFPLKQQMIDISARREMPLRDETNLLHLECHISQVATWSRIMFIIAIKDQPHFPIIWPAVVY